MLTPDAVKSFVHAFITIDLITAAVLYLVLLQFASDTSALNAAAPLIVRKPVNSFSGQVALAAHQKRNELQS